MSNDTATAAESGGRVAAPGPSGDPAVAGHTRPAERFGSVRGLWQRVPSLVRTVWLIPVLTIALLSLWNASRIELWADELTSVEISTRSVSGILRTMHNVDAVHGTYYLFLHVWIWAFGESPLVLRIPGILAVIGATALVSVTGRRLFGGQAGFIGGMVFALTPAIARYGTEIRSYPLVICAAALSTYLLVRAFEKPTWLRILGYAAALAATGLLNLVALTILAGHAVGIVIHVWKTRDDLKGRFLYLLRFAVGPLLGVVGTYPIVHLGMGQATEQIGAAAKPTIHDLFTMAPEIFCSALGAGVLICAGTMAWRVPRLRNLALMTSTAVLPILVTWLVSKEGSVSYFYFARYFVFCIPAWAVLAGAGIASVRNSRVAVAVVLVFACVVLPDQQEVHTTFSHSEYNYPTTPGFPIRDYRQAASIVRHGYEPGDEAVFGSHIDVSLGINYYLPANMQLRDVFTVESAAQANSIFPVYCSNPASCLSPQDHRLWVIVPGDVTDPFGGVHDGPTDPDSGLPAGEVTALTANYTIASVQHANGVTVALLVSK